MDVAYINISISQSTHKRLRQQERSKKKAGKNRASGLFSQWNKGSHPLATSCYPPYQPLPSQRVVTPCARWALTPTIRFNAALLYRSLQLQLLQLFPDTEKNI